MISQAYKGFTLSEIMSMSVRQRLYWYSMAKWRFNPIGG